MGVNAQTTVPTFTAAQVLTADQMNQSARTGVPVFADTTARDAGFGGAGEKTLAEGQLCYLESTDVVQYYNGSAWATVGPSTSGVVQVKSTTITGQFATTSTSFVDVTGLSVSITPTSASNKVLVLINGVGSVLAATQFPRINMVRTSTNIGQSTGGSSTNQTIAAFGTNSSGPFMNFSATFLDSPATTSATTYKVQVASSGGDSVRIGGSTDHGNISTITVMEVAP